MEPVHRLNPSATGSPFVQTGVGGPVESVGMGFALVLGATWLLAWSLGRVAAPRAVSRGRGAGRRPFSGEHPVFWYETWVRPRSRGRWNRWLKVIGIIGLLVLVFLISFLTGEDAWIGIGCIFSGFVLMVLVLLEAPVRGAWTGGDPRSEVALMATPLPHGRIALEKIASVLRGGLPLIVGSGAFLLVGVPIVRILDRDPVDLGFPLGLLMSIASVLLGVTGLGALGALLARVRGSATKGLSLAFSIVMGQAIFLPMLLAVMDFDDEAYLALVAATNPVVFSLWSVVRFPDLPPLGYLVVSLLLEGAIVACLVHITTSRWSALTLRRA